MKLLEDTQKSKEAAVEAAVNVDGKRRTCGFCGQQHAARRDACPANGTSCHACGKRNHWANVCRAKEKSDDEERSEPRERPSKGYILKQWNTGRSRKCHAVEEYDDEEERNDKNRWQEK